MMFLSMILLAAQAGQDDKAAEKAALEAVEAFRKAFKGTEAEKIAAIEDLGKVQHAKTINRLAGVLGATEATAVRVAAVRMLGKFSDQKKQAATPLTAALPAMTREPGIFAAICGALAELQEPSAVPALARYFEDKDEAVARRSMEAAGKMGSANAVDPLIAVASRAEKTYKNTAGAAGVSVPDGSGNTVYANPDTRARDRAQMLLTAANQALKELTGEAITTAEGWSAWWVRNKATFKK